MAEPKENQVYERFQWRYSKDKSNSGWTRTKKMVFGCAHFLSLPSKVLKGDEDEYGCAHFLSLHSKVLKGDEDE